MKHTATLDTYLKPTDCRNCHERIEAGVPHYSIIMERPGKATIFADMCVTCYESQVAAANAK